MSGLVVDASVAIKWYVAEESSDLADGILREPVDIHAPQLLKAEVANALCKYERRDVIDIEQAQLALQNVARAVNHWHPCDSYLAEALRLAIELDHPVYDFFYLCLARELGVSCVSADRRLLNKLSGTSLGSRVVHLADWRP